MSVEAFQDRATLVLVTVPVFRPVGTDGAVVSVGVVPSPLITGWAFLTRVTNWSSNHWPASGALGVAPVRLLFSFGETNVGSHIRSNRLPWSFGMSLEAPSDSPGGLIQTNASRYDDE